MVDTVKAIVGERNGTELAYHQEVKTGSDYLSAKGIAFEALATHVIEKIGGVIKQTIPSYSTKPTYVSDNITSFEIFNGFTQTTVNRLAKGAFTYTSDNLTQEIWEIYNTSDGTTVLKTITINHTYTGDDLIKSEVSEV